ncbi:MAG: PD-(D/E)XK nuclease family protein [Acidobacteriota bacterium]
MPLPKGYISFNQIRTYRSCPRQYYFSYIENIRTPINDKVFLGVVFHDAADFFLKRKIDGKTPDIIEISQYFTETFEEMAQKSEIIWSENREKSFKRGLAFIKYFAREIAPGIKPLMTEKEIECELPDSQIKMRGIIDLVEEDFSLTDFKTTTAKWSRDRVNKSFLQMFIYKFLFEESIGGFIKELKFKILYSKKATGVKHQEHSLPAEDVDMEKMFDVINFVIENIEKGYFYKNEGYICNFCDYKDLCSKTEI